MLLKNVKLQVKFNLYIMYIQIDDYGQISAIAPTHHIVVDGILIIHPKTSDYKKLNFLPIINEDEEPEYKEGYIAKEYYILTDNGNSYMKKFKYYEKQ